MDLKLNGKVALVTGAGSQTGYGRKIAVVLAREGCLVVAADINLDGAKQTAAEIQALGCQATGHCRGRHQEARGGPNDQRCP